MKPQGCGGYSFRLTRDEIPFQARILRAVDIFRALAQDRPYRNALLAARDPIATR